MAYRKGLFYGFFRPVTRIWPSRYAICILVMQTQVSELQVNSGWLLARNASHSETARCCS